MKKILLTAAMILGLISAQAQVTVQGSKFTDNWSVGINGGMMTPLKNHPFFGSARGSFGLEITKRITPVFGLGLEGRWMANTSSWTGLKSHTAIDSQYAGIFSSLNIMNIFGGYKGAPRTFEIEAIAGIGWLHSYYPKSIAGDGNSWGTRLGLNLNMNIGAARAWTLSIKPSLIWNMNSRSIKPNALGYAAAYNANSAAFGLEAGITYHFCNSNATRSFKTVKPADEARIASLNAEINELRARLERAGDEKAAIKARLNALQARLDECNSRPAIVKEVVKNIDNVSYIFFRQGSALIEPTQQPNIDMLAKILQNDPSATLRIEGYSSPDGNKAFNDRLATRRAEAVKKVLTQRYAIPSSRITATGNGVTTQFSESAWNRVAVCTINR